MEQEEQQPIPIAAPLMGGLSSEGALQYQFENIDLVETMLHYFIGEVESHDPRTGGIVWLKAFEPMINKRGLSKIRGYLTMFLIGSKNYALTDVNDEYIGDSVINVGKVIKDDFLDNWNHYEIKDYASASFMIDVITDVAYTIKKKGEGATYLKFLTKTHNINEIQHHQSMQQGNNMQQEKRGILGAIFGKKKRY